MLHVLKGQIAAKESIAPLRARPELRKATGQMLWALTAAEPCLAPFAAKLRDRIGLVLGSGQGELETTKEYYKALARENTARPFLFQNSLHHSTTGFLAQALKLTGPAATVSDSFFTAEAAIDLASDFLSSRLCVACLVVGVDTLVTDLEPGVAARFPEGFARGEGAAAFLLATDEGLIELGARPDFSFEPAGRRLQADRRFPELPGYYEADAIARLLEHRSAESLTLSKPDGTASLFRIGGRA